MQVRSGFTLVELMVALAAASILSLGVLAGLGRFQSTLFNLRKNYEAESRELLHLLHCSGPYPPEECLNGKTQD